MTVATSALTGEVVRPDDPDYEAGRIGWNRLYSRYPEAIVFCRETQDVVNAVEWAREEGVALRARSGRHSLDGWSSVDGARSSTCEERHDRRDGAHGDGRDGAHPEGDSADARAARTSVLMSRRNLLI